MTIECPGCGARYRMDPAKVSGTTARVRCPKCSVPFQVDLPPAVEAIVEAAPGAAKVLVVDDSKFFREMILDILSPMPFAFLTAADGVEALEVIRRERPVLVLLDLNLPRMNGYELIREVRSDVGLRDIRLLAMSGVFRKEADIREVERAGADDFINKSFKPEQLQERIRKMLKI